MFCFTGFQIIGGEKIGRLDLGVFISSVTPGGPADLDGCLKPGTSYFDISCALSNTWISTEGKSKFRQSQKDKKGWNF